MLKRLVPLALLLAVGAGVAAFAASSASPDRPDCPGKIICPLTGEPVCKDRCPLGADAETAADEASALPACCRSRS
ncbi:MAG: hypothetical protein ACYSU7_15540 [Planctomycetota bacterium]|jgi:hypothetical protein